MKFLALSYSKVFFAVPIFALLISFAFPIKVNAICDAGETCPQFNTLIKITEINNTPNFSGIQFWIIVLEIFISYIVAAIIITLTGVGGFMQFINRK